MFVRGIGSSVTVELDGKDCELLALACKGAAGMFDTDMPTIDAMRGFFIASAIICRMQGHTNIPDDVMKKMDAFQEEMNHIGD